MSLTQLKQIYEKFCSSVWKSLRLPSQTWRETRIIKDIFDHYSKQDLRIFEWGSGFSTLYYAKYLKKKSCRFEWYALENSKFWYEKVSNWIQENHLGENIFLTLREFPAFWEKSGWDWSRRPMNGFEPSSQNEKNYIQFPQTLSSKPINIFIVDGRFRRRCLKVALELAGSGGIVILHDAQKLHYHSTVRDFPAGFFLDGGPVFLGSQRRSQIWIGARTGADLTFLKKYEMLQVPHQCDHLCLKTLQEV